ncbi:MAG: nucleoside deaminase [Nitrospinota bacterium]
MQGSGVFLKQVEQEALRGIKKNLGGPFGAVIVLDGVVIGKGRNMVTSKNDPTAHAEIEAIRDACLARNSFLLKGAVLYSTCEPCPMCLGAIYWARIETVYYRSTRLDAAEAGFDDSFIYAEFNKAVSARKLKMVHVQDGDAESLFSIWKEKEDKIPY